ncbi:hypothetical protein XAC3824_580043 [Xanthomonas citri pv. citri]|nr:hypothetical protein XAC3824_580043 [Xanthomonas citri pv. citri]
MPAFSTPALPWDCRRSSTRWITTSSTTPRACRWQVLAGGCAIWMGCRHCCVRRSVLTRYHTACVACRPELQLIQSQARIVHLVEGFARTGAAPPM